MHGVELEQRWGQSVAGRGASGTEQAGEQRTAEGTGEEANVLWGSWALVPPNCPCSVAC